MAFRAARKEDEQQQHVDDGHQYTCTAASIAMPDEELKQTSMMMADNSVQINIASFNKQQSSFPSDETPAGESDDEDLDALMGAELDVLVQEADAELAQETETLANVATDEPITAVPSPKSLKGKGKQRQQCDGDDAHQQTPSRVPSKKPKRDIKTSSSPSSSEKQTAPAIKKKRTGKRKAEKRAELEALVEETLAAQGQEAALPLEGHEEQEEHETEHDRAAREMEAWKRSSRPRLPSFAPLERSKEENDVQITAARKRKADTSGQATSSKRAKTASKSRQGSSSATDVLAPVLTPSSASTLPADDGIHRKVLKAVEQCASKMPTWEDLLSTLR